MKQEIEPDTFTHQLVAVEDKRDCECGKSHREGDPLWGGVVDPNEAPIGIRNILSSLHSVDVEYRSTDDK